MNTSEEQWQDIAWNGVAFQLPRSWQPTIIYNSYLFFEQEGFPVFDIKWKQIRGSLSVKRTLKKLQKSLNAHNAVIEPWNIESELSTKSSTYTATGFQYRHDHRKYLGVLLFCPQCNHATMLQIYKTDKNSRHTLQHILQTFTDHQESLEQKWAIYDVSAWLPTQAKLVSHEFLLGRYALTFTLQNAKISLYRFKPAAVILQNQTLTKLAETLAGGPNFVKQGSNNVITSEYIASGFNRIPVFLKKNPTWTWLKLIHMEDKNGILAIKGTGKKNIDRQLLEKIADNFTITRTS